ncbi:DUF2057 family protein [Marinobacter sp. M1N3S26]|uniref:YccT family protein n=1 Tax=Marinobacter sp. M1N3S26 TaxID=3382299 RepID=UPI00387B98F7
MSYFSRFFPATLFTFILVFVAPVYADVTLRLGEGVELKAINGGLSGREGRELSLRNGSSQILVEYTTELGRNDDDSVLDTSDSFVIIFNSEDQYLTLEAPDISTRHEMRAFNDSARWVLRDADGNPHPFKSDVLDKDGFQFARNYEQELSDYNRAGSGSAAIVGLKGSDNRFFDNPDRNDEFPVARDQEMVREMLRYWYLKADENTKREMKRWINSSD